VQRNLEEIMTYVEDNFRLYELFERQMKQITRELMDLGYTLDEITRGINAYLLQLEPLSSDIRFREKILKRERSFRILDESESRYISRDAYGFLCQLRDLGLINREETEELIDYIVENRIEVENGEQLQSILMDMVLESETESGNMYPAEEDPLEEKPQHWHNFRKRRLH